MIHVQGLYVKLQQDPLLFAFVFIAASEGIGDPTRAEKERFQ